MYFPNFFFIFAKIKIKLPMIYKLDNGGIVKLQKAGKVLTPQQKLHEELDQIMAFNVEAKFNITYDKQGGVLKAQRGILTP